MERMQADTLPSDLELLEKLNEGYVALIHAKTVYTKPDGAPGAGRYTDIWQKREGRWLCVAAHVTRG